MTAPLSQHQPRFEIHTQGSGGTEKLSHHISFDDQYYTQNVEEIVEKPSRKGDDSKKKVNGKKPKPDEVFPLGEEKELKVF